MAGRLKSFGVADGAWKLPENSLESDSICYCAGAGENVSFDVALVNQFGCDVHIFDPTPRAIAHFETLRDRTNDGVPMPITNSTKHYEATDQTITKMHFHPFGVYGSNQTLRFYAPRDSRHVSHSVRNLQGTKDYFEAKCKTVRKLMDELGHNHLDLLKLDIEGAEHSVIDHLLVDQLRPRLLCIEFDAAFQQHEYAVAVEDLRRLVRFGYDLLDIKFWNATLVARDKQPQFATRLKLFKLGWRARRKTKQSKAAQKAA